MAEWIEEHRDLSDGSAWAIGSAGQGYDTRFWLLYSPSREGGRQTRAFIRFDRRMWRQRAQAIRAMDAEIAAASSTDPLR